MEDVATKSEDSMEKNLLDVDLNLQRVAYVWPYCPKKIENIGGLDISCKAFIITMLLRIFHEDYINLQSSASKCLSDLS